MSHPALTSTFAHLNLSAEVAQEIEPRVGDLLISDPSEPDVWVGRDRLAVELAHIGEGWEGEYDPGDPDDEPLLRFSVLGQTLDGEWISLERTSYCTGLSAHAAWEVRLAVAAQVFNEVAHLLSPGPGEDITEDTGRNAKRTCQGLSHLNEQELEPLPSLVRAQEKSRGLEKDLPPAVTAPRPRM